MRLLLLMLILPIVLAMWVVIVLAVPLPAAFPSAWSDGRNMLAAISAGLLGIGGMVGIAGFAVGQVLRAGSSLDAAFEALGLAPAGHRAFARHFEGVLGGRRATATLHPPFQLQPWRLTVSVDARPRVRLALGKHGPLVNSCKLPRIRLDDRELEACRVHAANQESGRQMVTSPAFRSGLKFFLETLVQPGTLEIHLESERIRLRLRAYRMQEEQVRQWLEGLAQLTAACEDAAL